MALGLGNSGLTTQTQAEIKEEIEALLRSTFGVGINTSTESIMGQLVNIVSELRSVDQQALLAVFKAYGANDAVGVGLDRLALLTGSARKAATQSTIVGNLVFTANGTVSDGETITNVGTATVWQAIGGPYIGLAGQTLTPVSFQAVDTGALTANAGTTWTNVTVGAFATFENPATNAIQGAPVESDVDFRVRRLIELFSNNQGPLAAISAVVSKVSGVTTVRTYHNPATNPTDTDGIPFKAFNVVVLTNPSTPTAVLSQNISNAIFSAMGAGGEAFGLTLPAANFFTNSVTDSEGQVQPNIRFNTVVDIPIAVAIVVTTAGTEDPISTTIESVIRTAVLAASSLGVIGRNQLNMDYSDIITNLKDSGQVTGLTQITSITLQRVSGGGVQDPLAIDIRERATLVTANLTITVNN